MHQSTALQKAHRNSRLRFTISRRVIDLLVETEAILTHYGNA